MSDKEILKLKNLLKLLEISCKLKRKSTVDALLRLTVKTNLSKEAEELVKELIDDSASFDLLKDRIEIIKTELL